MGTQVCCSINLIFGKYIFIYAIKLIELNRKNEMKCFSVFKMKFNISVLKRIREKEKNETRKKKKFSTQKSK